MKNAILAGVAAAAAATGVALAEDEGPFEMQIEARQGIMTYRALQLGTLGAMAKGEVAYDAATAQKAADNLMSATTIDLSMLWPEGSDNSATDETRALPALWSDPAVAEAGKAAFAATGALQAAAGKDLDSLKAAMGPMGEACGACHKLARASE
jgi:cytochrome c556